MDFGLTLWAAAGDSGLHHTLLVIWRIFLVLIGVNALIIVHEFGHFIVARMCGVRCEKFYIWFDAYNFRFFRFKIGQTEYGLGWVPLGGYVKMLGQEDNPSGIKNEIERAKLEAESAEGDAADKARERLAEQERYQKEIYAPDSYLSKNVFQRMAIISAGVIMNIIFAVLCAAWAYSIGFPEPTSRIGQVFPDSPAWKTGLLPGDLITAIDGKPCRLFSDIRLAMLDRKEVSLTVERSLSGTPETIEKRITPTMSKNQLTPTIGVYPSPSLRVAEGTAADILDPADRERMTELAEKVPAGSRISAIGGEPVDTPADYQRLARKNVAVPAVFEFTLPEGKSGQEGEKVTVEVPPRPFAETGIRFAMGGITSVADGSPAASAGLRCANLDETGTLVENGDVIVAVNNEPVLDPILFPYQIHRLAVKSGGNADIVLTVRRDGAEIDVPMTIAASDGYTDLISFNGRMASEELGVSYLVRPFVTGTDSSVRFDAAVNPIGLRIASIEVGLSEPEEGDPARPAYEALLKLGKPIPSGGFLYEVSEKPGEAHKRIFDFFTDYVNYLPTGTPLAIHLGIGSEPKTTLETTVTRPGNAYLVDRVLNLELSETRVARAETLGAALAGGWAKTVDSMGAIYRQLINIGRNVSAKAFGGPVMIVDIAYKATGTHDGTFLLFLCLISANLAVVNILPIPVLDGGHLLFLFYELIFRKRPNESVQVTLSYIGLFIILGLMVWVIFLDIARVIGWM
ncbi:MAG: site-2 protease family protein [Thermoguttaceae bacterium]|nr:site-2 protease family protein [Thermoguttaceae bacterium]